jgi:hypothetical protein
VDGFRPELVSWVLLADGRWCKVEGQSFKIEPCREWSAQHGVFAMGYSFACDNGHYMFGPVSSLICVAIQR